MKDLDDTTEAIAEFDRNRLLDGIGRGVVVAGRALGSGATALGQSAARAYYSVDPDLRRQVLQAPVLGLMNLLPRPDSEPPGRRRRPDASCQRDVLFVHGLAGHPSNFAALQHYFTHVAGRHTHAIDLRGVDSLDAMAGLLRDEIARRASHTPHRGVDLIAHSMGGIVARLAMEDGTTRSRVATLITMGTPHKGSHLARLAATPRTLDLRPGSPIMERLARQNFWSDGERPHLIALWSKADTIVLPATSAAWDAARSFHMSEYTHLSYLLNPASWRFLTRLLRQASPNLTA